MLDVAAVIENKNPNFFRQQPEFLREAIYGVLRKLVRESVVNDFLRQNQHLGAIEFVEKVLDYFAVDYKISNLDRENIPHSGPVMIIANHPLGALDALCLIKLISEVRRDIRVVANDIIAAARPVSSMILPVNNVNKQTARRDIENIIAALNEGVAVIIFPAGEVARASAAGVSDSKWQKGFLNIAKRAQAPILPVHIGARNSYLFYAMSAIYRPLSAMMLVREMFTGKNKTIHFRIGEMIPFHYVNQPGLTAKAQVKLLRKHLELIGKGRKGLFNTQKSIAHPEERRALKQELKRAQLLGKTTDNKQIFLFDSFPDSAVLRELGRLREFSFRAVGEGSGGRRDIDRFDLFYRHIIVWDEDELEIVGAYRLAEGWRVMTQQGANGFYTSTLFEFSTQFESYLSQAIELGRSFVQPKYWGTRALDYLWQGIGAYIKANSQVRYLFGPVSISASYPAAAKHLLVYYYNRYYGNSHGIVKAKSPFVVDRLHQRGLEQLFDGKNVSEAFDLLKQQMEHIDTTIPTLYKQYVDLCEPGGVEFLDFGIDKDFENCIDGFIFVDFSTLKANKRKRYIDRFDDDVTKPSSKSNNVVMLAR